MQSQAAATPRALARRLHPRLAKWFHEVFGDFTQAQLLCVPAILDRQSILLTSPTVQCIYVSPLRALAYDIGKNLRAPIIGMGLEKELRLHLRTGDTPAADRVKFRQRPAHFLITTPESLAVMLS